MGCRPACVATLQCSRIVLRPKNRDPAMAMVTVFSVVCFCLFSGFIFEMLNTDVMTGPMGGNAPFFFACSVAVRKCPLALQWWHIQIVSIFLLLLLHSSVLRYQKCRQARDLYFFLMVPQKRSETCTDLLLMVPVFSLGLE